MYTFDISYFIGKIKVILSSGIFVRTYTCDYVDNCVTNLDKETYKIAGSRYAMQCYPHLGPNIWSSESLEVVSFF